MRILGIDPGSRRTGVGIIEVRDGAVAPLCFGVIRAGDGDFPERLRLIFEGVRDLVREHQPDEVAVESVFVAHNAASAIKLGQARGAAICAAIERRLPVAEYAPRAVKQAVVGRGAADKAQVQHMVRVLLALEQSLAEDAADALAVALCHHHTRGTLAQIAAARR